jgi:hypothetical protein
MKAIAILSLICAASNVFAAPTTETSDVHLHKRQWPPVVAAGVAGAVVGGTLLAGAGIFTAGATYRFLHPKRKPNGCDINSEAITQMTQQCGPKCYFNMTTCELIAA